MELDPFSKEQVIAHAAHMRDFKGSQAHDVWLQYLERLERGHVNTVATRVDLPFDQMRYEQGVIEGIKLARLIPDRVIEWGKSAEKALDKNRAKVA